jgi:hypothetical protein
MLSFKANGGKKDATATKGVAVASFLGDWARSDYSVFMTAAAGWRGFCGHACAAA